MTIIRAFMIVGCAVGFSCACRADSNIEFKVNPTKDLKKGAPLILDLTLKNTGKIDRSVKLGSHLSSNVVFELNGKSYTYTGPTAGFSRGPSINLEPNRSFAYSVLLTEWTGPLSAGKYKGRCFVREQPELQSEFSFEVQLAENLEILEFVRSAILEIKKNNDIERTNLLNRWLACLPKTINRDLMKEVSDHLTDQEKAVLENSLKINNIVD